MNCKQGDIARIIHIQHLPKAEGHLVEVLRRDTLWNQEHVPAWACKTLSRLPCMAAESRGEKPFAYSAPAGIECVIPDAYLRPIRPGDGADETLQWAGKPQPAEVH